MKSIIIILVICVGLASAELAAVNPKDIATDFINDNILNPFLQDIKNNTMNFLLNQVTSSLFNLIFGGIGKRDVASIEYLNHINSIISEFSQTVDNLYKKLIDAIRNLSKEELAPFLESLKIEVKNEINQFLNNLHKFLSGYFGQKFPVNAKNIYLNITNVVDNFASQFIHSINNAGQLAIHGKF